MIAWLLKPKKIYVGPNDCIFKNKLKYVTKKGLYQRQKI